MTATLPLAAVIMTKNEERNIVDAVRSVQGFGQVFVVDSGSTDRTRAFALQHGAEVVDFKWNGRYPKKKQWCLENLPFLYDWILYLDADERLTPELESELRRLFSSGAPEAAGFFVRLDYVFLGKVLRHGHSVLKLALVDRRNARFVDRDDLDAINMWEVEGHYQPEVNGRIDRLRGRILHWDHDDLFHYFDRHNRYSDWEATLAAKDFGSALDETQTPIRRLTKRAFMRLPFKAPLFFLYFYVVKLGFLDGGPGLHYAVAKSFYYWQIGLKTRELFAKGA